MYPVLRLITASVRASIQGNRHASDVFENSFICMPWDIDMFLEMNNGRVLTLCDVGRFVMAIRIGLIRILREKKWGLVVAGSTVQYRKRIRMFDKVTLRTQIAAYDDRWIYITQSMWVGGKPASSVLLRTGVTSKGRVIASDQVRTAMGLQDWQPEPSPWVQAWIDSKLLRPWPPNSSATS
jgi:acyl-CoA thioesterase FadM